MNESARLILARLDARRLLLTSLLPDAHGKWLAPDTVTGLYHGKVHGVFALVPLEHADVLTQKDCATILQRGLNDYLRGTKTVSMWQAIQDEMDLIETEAAWVKECG